MNMTGTMNLSVTPIGLKEYTHILCFRKFPIKTVLCSQHSMIYTLQFVYIFYYGFIIVKSPWLCSRSFASDFLWYTG